MIPVAVVGTVVAANRLFRHAKRDIWPSRRNGGRLRVHADSEGKRIGQRSDSKSDAQQWVVGSNPMPSAPVFPRKTPILAPETGLFSCADPKPPIEEISVHVLRCPVLRLSRRCAGWRGTPDGRRHGDRPWSLGHVVAFPRSPLQRAVLRLHGIPCRCRPQGCESRRR